MRRSEGSVAAKADTVVQPRLRNESTAEVQASGGKGLTKQSFVEYASIRHLAIFSFGFHIAAILPSTTACLDKQKLA